MIRQRVRIRFRKQGDLRFIGHRDLVRTFERLFRRAGLSLAMTEGFHPKAKMSYPSALAVGTEGNDEVMELELTPTVTEGPLDTDALTELLNRHAPLGLTVVQTEQRPEGCPKACVRYVEYELPVPGERLTSVQNAIDQLLSRSSVLIQRPGRNEPIDVRSGLETLQLDVGMLRFAQSTSPTVSARPRELLELLGLADVEAQGCWLRRTKVELAA